jgi:hypothetical protein
MSTQFTNAVWNVAPGWFSKAIKIRVNPSYHDVGERPIALSSM